MINVGRTRSKSSFGEDTGDSKSLPKVECDDSLPDKVSLTDVKGGVLLPVLATDRCDGESSTSDVKDAGDNVFLPKVNGDNSLGGGEVSSGVTVSESLL